MADEYQFMTDGEQAKGAMQTLAPATEEQLEEVGPQELANMQDEQGDGNDCAGETQSSAPSEMEEN